MSNFLARYFNNRNEEALQVDEDGLYQDSQTVLYKYWYYDQKIGWWNQKKPYKTDWVKIPPWRIIAWFKKNEKMDIRIFEYKRKFL